MNSSLLTVDEPDGFPVDSIVKCIAHRNEPDLIGMYVKVSSKPIYKDMVRSNGIPDDGFYGQFVDSLDGEAGAFWALSWMRPATQDEIAAL